MIGLASDHAGYRLKESLKSLLDEMGLEYKDYGTNSLESVDYPVFAQKAAKGVVSGEVEKAIICCGTGVGISIAANKVQGIRCVCCSDAFSAKLSRMHNNSNILAMGERVLGDENAKMIAKIWLTTEFEGGRHSKRIDQIAAIEKGEQL